MRRSLVLLSIAACVAAAGCGGGGGETVTLGRTDEVLPTQPESTPSHAAAATTKEKFVEQCGACHTLKAAGANGVVGPNLDKVKPSVATVRRWIRDGSSDSVMPPGLFEGAEARSVAAYVARVAGRPQPEG